LLQGWQVRLLVRLLVWLWGQVLFLLLCLMQLLIQLLHLLTQMLMLLMKEVLNTLLLLIAQQFILPHTLLILHMAVVHLFSL
jgi:hypothetical protein